MILYLTVQSVFKLVRFQFTKCLSLTGSPARSQDSMGGRFDVTQSFMGELADLQFWSRVLTASEIYSQATCSSHLVGDVISWSEELVELHGGLTEHPFEPCHWGTAPDISKTYSDTTAQPFFKTLGNFNTFGKLTPLTPPPTALSGFSSRWCHSKSSATGSRRTTNYFFAFFWAYFSPFPCGFLCLPHTHF